MTAVYLEAAKGAGMPPVQDRFHPTGLAKTDDKGELCGSTGENLIKLFLIETNHLCDTVHGFQKQGAQDKTFFFFNICIYFLLRPVSFSDVKIRFWGLNGHRWRLIKTS